MIYIFTALPIEAKSMIREFRLKRLDEKFPFSVYTNVEDIYLKKSSAGDIQKQSGKDAEIDLKKSSADGIMLTVTGVGKISMATAVSAVLTKYMICPEDYVLNFGTAAGEISDIETGRLYICNKISDCETGRLYICNKISDCETGRDFYPDMIMDFSKHIDKGRYEECTLKTSDRIYVEKAGEDERLASEGKFTDESTASDGDFAVESLVLHDMEGSAFFEAAAFFTSPDRIMLFKCISDFGKKEQMTRQAVENAVENVIIDFKNVLDVLKLNMTSVFKADVKDFSGMLAEEMKCSESMKINLNKMLTYAYVSKIDVGEIYDDFHQRELLPCRTRKDGKEVLRRFQEIVNGTH